MIVEPQPRHAPLSVPEVRSIAAGLERGDCISVAWVTGGRLNSRRGTFRSIGLSNFLLESSSGSLFSIYANEIIEIRKISFAEMSLPSHEWRRRMKSQ
jgi:hypothetical protein